MNMHIETARLILRDLLPTDVEGMYRMDADPDVHKYLGNNPVTSKEQIIDIIAFIRQQYIDHGIGRWAIIDKESNDFVGWAGLKYITEETNGHKHYYDLGYRLAKRYWGQGIATEAALATLAYAFDILGLNVVYAMADCENIGSNKILKKIGFTCVEVFEDDGTPCNWYKIEKPGT